MWRLHHPPPSSSSLPPAHHRHPLRPFFASLPSSSSSSPAAPVSLSTASNGHLQHLCNQGNLSEALRLLGDNGDRCLTQRTYEVLILACTKRKALRLGRVVHRHLSVAGLVQDAFLATKLVNMYSACESIDDARLVFDSVAKPSIFLYNSLLRALAMIGCLEESLSLFQRLIGDSNVEIDRFTYPCVLKACCGSTMLLFGKQIHAYALRHGFQYDVHISTTLVDMYAKCKCIEYARKVFVKMPERNVVSWSAMIASLVNNGQVLEALEIFQAMMEAGVEPTAVTLVSVAQALGLLGALEQGRMAHAFVLRRELDSILSVKNSLVSMYARCGSLHCSKKVFDQMPKRDTVSWNSMIAGYGINGLGGQAIEVFEEMIRVGIPPSKLTFVSLLGACSHVGLVCKALQFFQSMEEDYGFSPSAEHYACMVDTLGRSGRLDEAANLIEKMQTEPTATVWGALLGACRIHGNVELAERAAEFLFQLEPQNAGNYVLLADIYAMAKRPEDVARMKRMVEERGLRKVAGCSWIEVQRKMYTFVSVEEPNPQMEQIHALVNKLSQEMKRGGYVPNTDIVLYELERNEKERILLGHSEKLALAFGLINTDGQQTIRITKNLRLCEDCHSMTKFVSKLTGREILVRDVNRFHHFKDGSCSCSDYW